MRLRYDHLVLPKIDSGVRGWLEKSGRAPGSRIYSTKENFVVWISWFDEFVTPWILQEINRQVELLISRSVAC